MGAADVDRVDDSVVGDDIAVVFGLGTVVPAQGAVVGIAGVKAVSGVVGALKVNLLLDCQGDGHQSIEPGHDLYFPGHVGGSAGVEVDGRHGNRNVAGAGNDGIVCGRDGQGNRIIGSIQKARDLVGAVSLLGPTIRFEDVIDPALGVEVGKALLDARFGHGDGLI